MPPRSGRRTSPSDHRRPVRCFSNIDPFASHPSENEHEQNLRIALLARRRVPACDLAEAFDKSERTVYRYLETLREDGSKAFHETPSQRGRSAIDGEMQAKAERHLSEGRSIGESAVEPGIVIRRRATISKRAGSRPHRPPPANRNLRRRTSRKFRLRSKGTPPRPAAPIAIFATAGLWAEPPGPRRVGSAQPSAT